jgi:CRP/FNR family cyclic AMP-dependent transcriptional regulator
MASARNRDELLLFHLRRFPLFQTLSDGQLRPLVARVVVKTFQERDVVVRQAEPGGDMFAIIRGHLKVTARGQSGKDALLALMGPGEVFGEVTLLDGSPRSATVTCLERTEVVVVERTTFLAFLESTPKVAIHLVEALSKRLRRISERSEDIAFLDVSRRLAKALLQLSREYGAVPEGEEHVRIALKLTQQELGDLVGATRESVNKHLGHWMQQGVLRLEGQHIVVADSVAMQTMADFEPWK